LGIGYAWSEAVQHVLDIVTATPKGRGGGQQQQQVVARNRNQDKLEAPCQHTSTDGWHANLVFGAHPETAATDGIL